MASAKANRIFLDFAREVGLTGELGKGDEVQLLNGLLALGYDAQKVQSFSDRDPNRRFLDDAITRALKAGVSADDIKRAMTFDHVARTEQDPVRRVQRLGEALGMDVESVRQKANQYGGGADAWVRAFSETPGAEFTSMAGTRRVMGTDLARQTFSQYATFQHGTYTGKGVQRGAPTPGAPGAPAPGAPPGALPEPSPTGGITPAPAGSEATKAGAAGKTGTPGGLLDIPDTSTLPKPMSPEAAEEFIRDHYGYMGALLDIPDIHNILYGIARGEIAPDEFDHKLLATDWSKTRNDATQAWEILKSTKPAEADAKLLQSTEEVKSFAVGLGFTLDESTAKEIATSALSMGWDPSQTRKAVAGQYRYTTGTSAVSGVAKRLKGTAADYLVPLGDEALTQWGQQLISGTATLDDFTAYARTQAKAQYPGLGAWLDADPTRTMKQFVEPYAQQAGQILEIGADSIDFTSPKYNALFGKLDPKTGERSVMTGPEWSAYLKQQPEWQYTRNANETVSNLTATLAKTFGQVG